MKRIKLFEDFINEESSVSTALVAHDGRLVPNRYNIPRKIMETPEFQLTLPPNTSNNWFDILRKIDEILAASAGKTGSSFCENFSKARLKLNPQSVRFFLKELREWEDFIKEGFTSYDLDLGKIVYHPEIADKYNKYLKILEERMEQQKLDDVQRASESVERFMVLLESDTQLMDIDKRLKYLEKAGAEPRKIDIQKQNKLIYLGDQFLKLNKSQMPEPEKGNFSGDLGYFLTYFNTSIYDYFSPYIRVDYYKSSNQFNYVDMNILDPVQVGHFLALKSGFENMPSKKEK